jgi:hypothetical protein
MSEASAAAERHPPGPLRMLRARVGAMRTMSRRLRLVTGVAIAQLFAAAALLAVHDLKMSSTPVAAAARLSSIANPIFIVCIFFLAFAWSYLLVGALHSHWLVRIAALLFFTYVAARSADGVYLRGFYQWPWVATVGALWLFAAGTWIVDLRRESRGDHGSPSVVRLSIVFILMLALYASFRWGGNSFYRAQNSRGFTNLISTQLNDLAI